MNEPITAAPTLLSITSSSSDRKRDDAAPDGFADELNAAADYRSGKPSASERSRGDSKADSASKNEPPLDNAAANDTPSREGEPTDAIAEEGHADPLAGEALEVDLLETIAATETLVYATPPSATAPEEVFAAIDIDASGELVTIEPDSLSPDPVTPAEGEQAPTGGGDALTASLPGAEALDEGATAETNGLAVDDAQAIAASTAAATRSTEQGSGATEEPTGDGVSVSAGATDVGGFGAESAERNAAGNATTPTTASTPDPATGDPSASSSAATAAAPPTPKPLAAEADFDADAADLASADDAGSPRESTTTPSPAGSERAVTRAEAARATAVESPPPVDPARFVSRVARAIDFANERGGGPIEMRLSPPELGSLQVKIELKEGAMVARLEAETPAARQTLLDNLPALRERLEQQQIRIDKFDVDVRDESQQRGGDWQPREDSQQRPEERDQREPPPRSVDREPLTDGAVDPAAQTITFDDDGINLVA